MKSKITFATFFPECENIHLTKDVGMIPYIMHRNWGYDSHVICYRNGNYPSLRDEVFGLKLLFMRPCESLLAKMIKSICERSQFLSEKLKLLLTILDVLPLILRHRFNVFQVYELSWRSIIVGLIYRLFNRGGILYLKLDMNPSIIESYKKSPKLSRLRWKNLFAIMLIKLASFNIISVENRELYNFIKTGHPILMNFSNHIYYLPNGVDVKKLATLVDNFDKKENIILHVGRIGSYQKGSDIVLEAFAKISADFPDWKLLLVGEMESSFKYYMEAFLKNERMKDKIFYLGFVSKRELYEHYNKAKIFAFPSRFEGFALAPIEAGFFGDVIVGSDLPCLREITNNGNLGYLCPINDAKCFRNALRSALSNGNLREKAESLKNLIMSDFDWNKICGILHELIGHKYKTSSNKFRERPFEEMLRCQ